MPPSDTAAATAPGSRAPRRWLGAVLLLALSALLVGVAEVAIRVAGIERIVSRQVSKKLYPVNADEGETLFATRVFDPVVQWRLRPDAWLPQHIGRIDTDGFVGREIRWQKPPGRVRLLTLGDSVTYGVWACGFLKMCRDRPYATELELMLYTRTQSDRYEVVNGAVYGHNSTQGLRYYRTYLAALQPDIVTVMFGWNDASATFGREGVEFRQPVARAVAHAAESSAVYRTLAGLAAYVSLSASGGPQWKIPDAYVPRTTLEEFGLNLADLTRDVRDRGGKILFVTEPAGPMSEPYRTKEIPVPWDLYRLKSYESMLARHAEYNAAVRAAGATLGVPVVDADAEFNRRGIDGLFHPYDMIHPNAEGYAVIAQMIFDRLTAEGWVDAPPAAAVPAGVLQ